MKQILVAVDGSEVGNAAVETAAELAAKFGLPSVTLISVIPVAVSTIGVSTTAAAPEDIEAWEAFDKPKQILSRFGIQPKLLLKEGDPAAEIVAAAQDGGFDLIVVGHRGLSPIKAFLLGSVSDRVVSHAPCSVLVVRPAKQAS